MFGDAAMEMANSLNTKGEIQLIKELNTLSLPELKTFAQSTSDKHAKNLALTLYREKLSAQDSSSDNRYQKCVEDSTKTNYL